MDELESIRRELKVDRMRAAERLGRALMAGDPDTFKAGYSRENAVMATGEMLGLTAYECDLLRERLPEL
jgi:hypothetical protein